MVQTTELIKNLQILHVWKWNKKGLVLLVVQPLSVPVTTQKTTREVKWLSCSAQAGGAVGTREGTVPALQRVAFHSPPRLLCSTTAHLAGLRQETNTVTEIPVSDIHLLHSSRWNRVENKVNFGPLQIRILFVAPSSKWFSLTCQNRVRLG